jgi:hypothetical protein
VEAEGCRFENLAAGRLPGRVRFERDVRGRDLELGYLRDADGRAPREAASGFLPPLVFAAERPGFLDGAMPVAGEACRAESAAVPKVRHSSEEHTAEAITGDLEVEVARLHPRAGPGQARLRTLRSELRTAWQPGRNLVSAA